jgi:hypothetical protein
MGEGGVNPCDGSRAQIPHDVLLCMGRLGHGVNRRQAAHEGQRIFANASGLVILKYYYYFGIY